MIEKTRDEIADYLLDVKKLLRKGRGTFADNREENVRLFKDYVISQVERENIVYDLKIEDFSEAVYNRKDGYEHEVLYIFGKEVELLERYGNKTRIVPLYIKFNKIEESLVIVISFHEQERPLRYYFKKGELSDE